MITNLQTINHRGKNWYHLHSLKDRQWHDVRNQGPGLGQAQKCGILKWFHKTGHPPIRKISQDKLHCSYYSVPATLVTKTTHW
jgi:hypothetical protein